MKQMSFILLWHDRTIGAQTFTWVVLDDVNSQFILELRFEDRLVLKYINLIKYIKSVWKIKRVWFRLLS